MAFGATELPPEIKDEPPLPLHERFKSALPGLSCGWFLKSAKANAGAIARSEITIDVAASSVIFEIMSFKVLPPFHLIGSMPTIHYYLLFTVKFQVTG